MAKTRGIFPQYGFNRSFVPGRLNTPAPGPERQSGAPVFGGGVIPPVNSFRPDRRMEVGAANPRRQPGLARPPGQQFMRPPEVYRNPPWLRPNFNRYGFANPWAKAKLPASFVKPPPPPSRNVEEESRETRQRGLDTLNQLAGQQFGASGREQYLSMLRKQLDQQKRLAQREMFNRTSAAGLGGVTGVTAAGQTDVGMRADESALGTMLNAELGLRGFDRDTLREVAAGEREMAGQDRASWQQGLDRDLDRYRTDTALEEQRRQFDRTQDWLEESTTTPSMDQWIKENSRTLGRYEATRRAYGITDPRERRRLAERLREQGLINDEEYSAALADADEDITARQEERDLPAREEEKARQLKREAVRARMKREDSDWNISDALLDTLTDAQLDLLSSDAMNDDEVEEWFTSMYGEDVLTGRSRPVKRRDADG